jgi:hypothetical protein
MRKKIREIECKEVVAKWRTRLQHGEIPEEEEAR